MEKCDFPFDDYFTFVQNPFILPRSWETWWNHFYIVTDLAVRALPKQLKGVSKKRVLFRFLSYLCSRNRSLLFHMCFLCLPGNLLLTTGRHNHFTPSCVASAIQLKPFLRDLYQRSNLNKYLDWSITPTCYFLKSFRTYFIQSSKDTGLIFIGFDHKLC